MEEIKRNDTIIDSMNEDDAEKIAQITEDLTDPGTEDVPETAGPAVEVTPQENVPEPEEIPESEELPESEDIAEDTAEDDCEQEDASESDYDQEETSDDDYDPEDMDLEDFIFEDEEPDNSDLNKTRIMKMMKPVINIAWMYPDTLYLHGERGNVMALVRYAQYLGLEPKIHKIDMGTKGFNPMEYDILFYGPGEITSFKSVIRDIGTYTRSLAEYIASGKILLVTGTTMAMFGERIRRYDPDAPNKSGEVIEGLCLIPVLSDEREYVFGDDEYIVAEYGGYSMELVGSQIQMADIEFLENSSFRRFGSVIYGRGNNGEDEIEGVVYNNSIFTNMLGPLLVNNPWLTVQILKKAAELKGIEIKAPDPTYNLEVTSLNFKKEFIQEKMGSDFE